jgi:anti-sigma factor RsiW
MSTHLTARTIDDYLDLALAPEDLLACTRHLETCSACQQIIAAHGGVRSRLAAARVALERPDPHIDDDELTAFGNGGLDPDRHHAVARHLSNCVSCTAKDAHLRRSRVEAQFARRVGEPPTMGARLRRLFGGGRPA